MILKKNSQVQVELQIQLTAQELQTSTSCCRATVESWSSRVCSLSSTFGLHFQDVSSTLQAAQVQKSRGTQLLSWLKQPGTCRAGRDCKRRTILVVF